MPPSHLLQVKYGRLAREWEPPIRCSIFSDSALQERCRWNREAAHAQFEPMLSYQVFNYMFAWYMRKEIAQISPVLSGMEFDDGHMQHVHAHAAGSISCIYTDVAWSACICWFCMILHIFKGYSMCKHAQMLRICCIISILHAHMLSPKLTKTKTSGFPKKPRFSFKSYSPTFL